MGLVPGKDDKFKGYKFNKFKACGRLFALAKIYGEFVTILT